MILLDRSPTTALAILTATLAAFGPSALAQDKAAFEPDEFYVEGLTYDGPACPAGSLSFNVAPDASQLTLLLADFRIDGERTAACKIELLVHAPPGWSFAPVAAEIYGFARLGKGVPARQSLTLTQPATRRAILASHEWKGPLTGDYRIKDRLAPQRWLPCAGRPANDGVVSLSLLSEAAVVGQPGTLRGASVDGELRQRLELAWRRCDPRTGEAIPTTATAVKR